MNYIIRVCLSLSLVFTSPYAFGEEAKDNNTQCETQINCTIQNGNTTTTTATPNTSSGGTVINRGVSGLTTTTTTTNYGSAGTAGTGAYTQAQAAKNQANNTMMLAFAMAAMMAAMCNPPHNIVPCILAPLAALAGVMAGQKKDQAQNVMNSLGSTDSTNGTKDTSRTTDGTATANAELAKIKADLAKKGYAMNADGSTTLPNGKTVASDLNPQSLQAAGLSASDIGKVQSEIDKMKKEFNNNTSGAGETSVASADGFGGRVRIDDDGSRDMRKTASVEADRTDVDKDSPNLTGLFKQFGDSQIGVAQSDIFLMVEKRVDKERKIMGQ